MHFSCQQRCKGTQAVCIYSQACAKAQQWAEGGRCGSDWHGLCLQEAQLTRLVHTGFSNLSTVDTLGQRILG